MKTVMHFILSSSAMDLQPTFRTSCFTKRSKNALREWISSFDGLRLSTIRYKQK